MADKGLGDPQYPWTRTELTDDFGTHKITLSGRDKRFGARNMFEVRETDDDRHGRQHLGAVWLKDDATFDFETLKGRTEATATSITLSITVTATDGGGLQTRPVCSRSTIMDADTDDDPKADYSEGRRPMLRLPKFRAWKTMPTTAMMTVPLFLRMTVAHSSATTLGLTSETIYWTATCWQ